MTHSLVICIGNVARGDDGVGHEVAAILGESATGMPPDAHVVTAVGLDVAMAADVAKCELLVIVDAERRATPPVSVSELAPGTAAHSGHAIDAPGLLAVTAALYGASPRALLVSVAAPEMGHAEVLSATSKAASREAASAVLDILRVI